MIQVIAQRQCCNLVQGGLHGPDLLDYINTVSVIFDHDMIADDSEYSATNVANYELSASSWELRRARASFPLAAGFHNTKYLGPRGEPSRSTTRTGLPISRDVCSPGFAIVALDATKTISAVVG